MGLDIYHCKASLERPEESALFAGDAYILEEDYSYFDVDFHYFAPFSQMIDVPRIGKTIYFPKSARYADMIKKSVLIDDKCEILLVPNEIEMVDRLEAFVERNHLSHLLRHRFDMLGWTQFDLYDHESKFGFYSLEVGYQRKGMRPDKFWKRFMSDDVYNFTTRDDFEYALSCVENRVFPPSGHNQIHLFKRDFVDAYEQNRSWLALSY
ncbi:hypothetical protein [Pseudochryseolinea flava]|uniref:Uncharacterized protein n=1 Tax=Pseudochryseolinea flava TaxID=2059302 RepID=A0A364XYX2_9BACT|nr:hypothetical protein [Pseudochryseolinea flava]RAV99189.1 hypothetical protein DQQ10_20020 [Pseudochryseolinea flava]